MKLVHWCSQASCRLYGVPEVISSCVMTVTSTRYIAERVRKLIGNVYIVLYSVDVERDVTRKMVLSYCHSLYLRRMLLISIPYKHFV